ncbi:FG-GAP-like repeat-containing protein [Roseateles chitinivorans]|uniref:FG-GAP-like repeat-containing protein n=1 Tax=Roseateles chitinivorans TaxID=2917965 RepID=UPI003D66D53B
MPQISDLLNAFRRCRRLAAAGSSLAVVSSILALLHPGQALAQFDVSQMGQSVYRYQIEVPPGVRDMLPDVTLQYDGAPQGIAGEGWHLAVGSTIGRCAATFATDGARAPVRNIATDKLCLDGKRLIQTDANGSPLPFPQTGDSQGLTSGYREFRSEIDSYARIRAYGAANGDVKNGPAYFKVWTKAGQIFELGTGPSADANSGALLTAGSSGAAVAWAVARISDKAGNYIDFKHGQNTVSWGSGASAGSPLPAIEWRLDEIEYTGNVNASQAPTNRVVFEYEDRPTRGGSPLDANEAFHLGIKSVQVARLKAVTTYVNAPYQGARYGGGGTAVKKFILAYESGVLTGRSRLKTITACNGAGSRCFKPTSFDYKDGSGDAYVRSSGFNLQTEDLRNSSGTTGVFAADFDGDGKTDILRWSDTPASNRLYLSRGDGSFQPVPVGSGAGQFNITDQNLGRSDGCYYTVVADFNGDGLPDLLRFAGSSTSSGASCPVPRNHYLYLNQGGGSFSAPKLLTGLTQLDRVVSKATTDCIHPVQSVATSLCTEPGVKRGWTPGYTFYMLDVDGDGKMDIVAAQLPGARPTDSPQDPCPQIQCTWILKGDGQGGFTDITPAASVNLSMYSAPDTLNAVGQPTHVIDVDGDGLYDIVRTNGGSYRSLGNGTFDAPTDAQFCGYSIDFNGDGVNDCLQVLGAASSLISLQWGDGTGMSFATGNTNLKTAGADLFGTGIGIAILDLNGDGRDDLLRWKDGGDNKLFLSQGDGTFVPSTTFNISGIDAELGNSAGTISFIAGNFTGYGQTELLRLKNGSHQLYVKSDPTPADQLWRVVTPAGRETRWISQPLSHIAADTAGIRYLSDRGTSNAAVYPDVDLTTSIQVVTTLIEDSGVGTVGNKTTNQTEYAYRGLKTSLNGRGVLGFRQRLNQGLGGTGAPLSVREEYSQSYPYIGLRSRTEIFASTIDGQASSNRLRSVVASYCDQTSTEAAEFCASSAKLRRPYVRQTVESGWELNGEALPVTTVVSAVNGFGDTTSSTKSTTGIAAGISQTFSQTTVSQYEPPTVDADNWSLGRLSRRTVTNSVPNNINDIGTSAGTGPNALATTLRSSASLSDVVLGNITVGGAKSGQATLSNSGRGALAVAQGGIAVSGANVQLIGNNCPASLKEGESCAITVSVAPTALSAYGGSVSVATGGGTKSSAVSATGVAPTAVITPQSTNWGVVGSASDSGDWLTVTNRSDVSVRIVGHSVVSGPAGMWAWQGISDAGYCLVGSTVLAPGASCKTFFGTGTVTSGSYGVANQIAYQAVNAPATTFTVQQGYSFSMATSTVNVGTLAFGNATVFGTSAPQSFTLTNNAINGGSLLNLSISLVGASPASYGLSHNCGSALGAGATCTVNVTFSPTAIVNGVSAAVAVSGGMRG